MAEEREIENKKGDDFVRGDKVLFLPERKVYDFGYMGQTGMAIIYEEGCRNVQDSYAVDIKQLIRIKTVGE